MKPREYKYIFTASNGEEISYEISDPHEISNSKHPEFTKLSACQCENCPLKEADVKDCPVAVSIVDVIDRFKDQLSYDEYEVKVISNSREYYKKTTLQEGLQSMMGLLMATSGCPHFSFLNIMAAHHLPFSNYHETMVRVLSFALLESYLNEEQNFEIDELLNKYQNLSIVNKGLCNRLRNLEVKDAGKNAIVILDSFIQLFSSDYDLNFKSLKKTLLAN